MSVYPLKDGGRMHIGTGDPADAAEILQFLQLASGESDFLVSTPEDFHMTVEAERSWLAGMAADAASVNLVGKVDGRVMAIATLTTPKRPRIAHTSEFSILVSRAFWGQGVGTAMMDELRERVKAIPGLRLLHLGVRDDNTRAIALYHSFGFKVAGRLPGFFCVDGVYHDQLVMALDLTAGQ